MKRSINLVALFIMSFGLMSGVLAQSKPSVIAVINKAEWCHVCKANGEKMMKEVMPMADKNSVSFVMNDLTNKETIKRSKKALKYVRVYKAVKPVEATGLLLLVNSISGKIIEQISVAEPTDKLLMAIKKAAMK